MDRRRIARIGRLAAIAGWLTLQQGPLLAWETDVHHTLTQWLALQAGFSGQNANLIARGAQSYDDSSYTDALGNVVYLCLTGDSTGAVELQQRHFPTDALLPSPPRSRPIMPGSQAARAAAEASITRKPQANTMLLLGRDLHPLQDSWAHQGVPDVPWGCPHPNLVSAHPEDRGGWWRHRADKTHLWVDDVLDTAKATYEILRAYLTEHQVYAVTQPASWQALAPHVRRFAEASSDNEKDAWAVKHLAPPQGLQQQASPAVPRFNGDVARVVAIPVPPDDHFDVDSVDTEQLVPSAEAFFGAWLVERDIDSAVEWIDIEALAAQFAGHPILANSEDARVWARRFLVMLLVSDHDLVEAVGHGDPRDPRYGELPDTLVVEGPFRAVSMAAPPRLTPNDFFRVSPDAEAARGLILSFSNLPHDSVGLTWRDAGERWLVTSMIAAPN